MWSFTHVTVEDPHLGPVTFPASVFWSVLHYLEWIPSCSSGLKFNQRVSSYLSNSHATISPMGISPMGLTDWYFSHQGRNFLVGSSLILLCSSTKVFDVFNNRVSSVLGYSGLAGKESLDSNGVMFFCCWMSSCIFPSLLPVIHYRCVVSISWWVWEEGSLLVGTGGSKTPMTADADSQVCF